MAMISREFLPARPMEIGKIKIGGRGRKAGKAYVPEKFDHFVVTTTKRDGDDGPFVRDEEVHKIVGDEPRELEAVLMYPKPEQNLHTEMATYQGGRRTAWCDGKVCTLRDGSSHACSFPECGHKPYVRLHVQLEANPVLGGFYVFRSHSWETLNNLQTAIEAIYREVGMLYRVPVTLVMDKTTDVYTDEKGTERTGSSWKVGMKLRLPPAETRLKLKEEAAQALADRKMLLLRAGEQDTSIMEEAQSFLQDLDETDLEDEQELADEFFPPKGVGAVAGTAEALRAVMSDVQEADYEVMVDYDAMELPQLFDLCRQQDLLNAEQIAWVEAVIAAPIKEKKKQGAEKLREILKGEDR